MTRIFRILFTALLIFISASSCRYSQSKLSERETDNFLNDLKYSTFLYFWEQADLPTGQIPDRYPTRHFTSIAATGFGIPAYIIGVENGYISRTEAADRVHHALEWLWQSHQGPEETGTTGYRGFYYHFLHYGTGERYKEVELSTIDTGLLIAGILAAQSYFDRSTLQETRIRELADSLYLRVEWDWAMNGQDHMSMGWHPESGFIQAKWTGYNEAMILLIMAMGSPTHPIPGKAWADWCEGYEWKEFYGREHVNFSPLFGHQYSHMFIDFRGIADPYMKTKGIDYFENSRRATLGNRDYCIDNPKGFRGYGENIWGLTACDGPANEIRRFGSDSIRFRKYHARGASALRIDDDGTIAPTAAGGSIPFAPEECIRALMHMKESFGNRLYQEYGFKDAFNLSYTFAEGQEEGWFDIDYIGIDQGPILIQLENYQTGLVWELMKRNKYIVNGLIRAGFTGGWLSEI